MSRDPFSHTVHVFDVFGSQLLLPEVVAHQVSSNMDVTKAIEAYITKMVSEPSAIKVLLLDSHTVRGTLIHFSTF